jgi:hypothetical protein
MAERARTGPRTPSHNAESTSNQRASVGCANVAQANKNPSENCQIRKPAKMMITMRRTPLALLGHSRSMMPSSKSLIMRGRSDAWLRRTIRQKQTWNFATRRDGNNEAFHPEHCQGVGCQFPRYTDASPLYFRAYMAEPVDCDCAWPKTALYHPIRGIECPS